MTNPVTLKIKFGQETEHRRDISAWADWINEEEQQYVTVMRAARDDVFCHVELLFLDLSDLLWLGVFSQLWYGGLSR